MFGGNGSFSGMGNGIFSFGGPTPTEDLPFFFYLSLNWNCALSGRSMHHNRLSDWTYNPKPLKLTGDETYFLTFSSYLSSQAKQGMGTKVQLQRELSLSTCTSNSLSIPSLAKCKVRPHITCCKAPPIQHSKCECEEETAPQWEPA